MRTLIFSASALAALALSGAAQAGVVHCEAEGTNQRTGAAIGAIAGAIIGNNVSHKAGAPIVGALGGAAAGSAIGCQTQKAQAKQGRLAGATGMNVATTTVAIRAQPTSRSNKVGALQRGERVQVLRFEGDWAVVGSRGRTMGYVSAAYLRPA